MIHLNEIETVDADRWLLIFSALSSKPYFKPSSWMYNKMISLVAEKRRWETSFELAFECVAVAGMLDFDEATPSTALKWTHPACLTRKHSPESSTKVGASKGQSTRVKQKQFGINNQHSDTFVQHVILPNQVDDKMDTQWTLKSKTPKVSWDSDTLSRWRTQLVRWKFDFSRNALL